VCAHFLRLHVSYLVSAGDAELERCLDVHNLTESGVPKYYTRDAMTCATVGQPAFVFDILITSVRDNAILHRRIHYFNYC
jgi:hypothetical protein